MTNTITGHASELFGTWGDGYDFMDAARGWTFFSGWGESGWDAGLWPYVIVGAREIPDGKAQSIYYVEGDVTIRTHENLDAAISHLDEIVLWHWQVDGNGPKDARDYTPETMPERYRGPFNWHRLCVARGEPFCSRCQNAQKGDA